VIYSRDGLTFTVTADSNAAADNLERLFFFWPVDDPPPPSRARTAEIEAAMAEAKRTPRTLNLDD
jgi:hypothetical protein